jgi:putative membrane protein
LHDGHGWHHGGWWILWLLAWALVVAVLVTLVWRSRRPPRDGDTAKSILAERYARGEISADEYRERQETLDKIRTP